MSSSSPEPECTPKCRSVVHAAQVINALTSRTELNLLPFIRSICYNYAHITDRLGRNALHMAASCGQHKIVKWLLEREKVDPNVKDLESGWTALHRSLYYGQLGAAKLLVEHGANVMAMDRGGYSPLDLVMSDRPPYVEFCLNSSCDVYVWGCNTNFNLGQETQQNRTYPEVLEFFRRGKLSIKQVIMCKYHTLFVTHEGKVYSCGHGQGGRVGNDSERTAITPIQVKALASEKCIEVAAGTNHSIFLTSQGKVWTCGLNTHHQLGHDPPPAQLLSPKPIKALKGVNITGVCAARFHSVLYSEDIVFTFGLNAGQLGHPKGYRTQIVPRQVSGLNLKDTKITFVTACDGATVCTTNRGDVLVLHEYQCRKIASKQTELARICAVGGHLDAKCDPSMLKDKGGQELKIFLLLKSGKVLIWQESCGQLLLCTFSCTRQLRISSIAPNNVSLLLTTVEGEAFLGTKLVRKSGCKQENGNAGTPHGKQEVVHSPKASNSLFDLFDKSDCEQFHVRRLQGIHRAVSVSCDPKGRNFAVIQTDPAISLLEEPEIGPTETCKQYSALFRETNLEDSIHDIVLQVGSYQFPAHSFILSSRSDYFEKVLQQQDVDSDIDSVITINGIHPKLFENLLQYTYTGSCDCLKAGFKFPVVKSEKQSANAVNSSPTVKDSGVSGLNHHTTSAFAIIEQQKGRSAAVKKNKTETVADPLKALIELSKKMGYHALVKSLNQLKCCDNEVVMSVSSDNKPLKFGRKRHLDLHDVCLLSEDGVEIECHKCILIARSEYFHSMLACDWLEASTSDALPLPVPADVLEAVVDYLYEDESPKVTSCEDKDFIGKVLIVSDLLLIERLKQICERALTHLISLKNATELLELSCVYQANQLRETCAEFICLNLPSIVENRSLANLSEEALDVLTKNYTAMIPAIKYRVITPYADTPTDERISKVIGNVCSSDVENDDVDVIRDDVCIETKKTKSKRKSRIRKSSSSEAVHGVPCDYLPSSPVNLDDGIAIPLSALKTSPTEPQSFDDSIVVSPSKFCESDGSVPSSPVMNFDIPLSPSSNDLKSLCWNGSSPTDSNLGLQQIMMMQELETKKLSHAVQKFPKKTTKVSQKQRKKSYKSEEKEELQPKTPDQLLITTAKNPWLKVDANVMSLQEIMSLEKKNVSYSNGLDRYGQTQNGSGMSVPQCGKQPDTNAANSESGNPWNHEPIGSCSPAKGFIPNFMDILNDEQKQRRELKRLQAKPLHLIQKEELAIEELLVYYNAEDNAEENVRVQRITPIVSSPIWNVATKKGTNSPSSKFF